MSTYNGERPIIRVYNGEPPKRFGLSKKDAILRWTGCEWVASYFFHLEHSDRWMPQPPAPKEVEHE